MSDTSSAQQKIRSQHSLRLRHLAETEKSKQRANSPSQWSRSYQAFNRSEDAREPNNNAAFLGYN